MGLLNLKITCCVPNLLLKSFRIHTPSWTMISVYWFLHYIYLSICLSIIYLVNSKNAYILVTEEFQEVFPRKCFLNFAQLRSQVFSNQLLKMQENIDKMTIWLNNITLYCSCFGAQSYIKTFPILYIILINNLQNNGSSVLNS